MRVLGLAMMEKDYLRSADYSTKLSEKCKKTDNWGFKQENNSRWKREQSKNLKKNQYDEFPLPPNFALKVGRI